MGLYLGTTSAGLEEALVKELQNLDEIISVEIFAESTFHGGVVFRTAHPPEVIVGLRALDSIYAFLDSRTDVPHDKEGGTSYFEDLPSQLDWGPPLRLFNQWRRFLASEGKNTKSEGSLVTDSKSDNGGSAASEVEQALDAVPELDVSFRVTCERICHKLKKHGFSSTNAAGALGSGMHRKFGWPGNMRRFDLEVQAWIKDSNLLLAIPLVYSDHRETTVAVSASLVKGTYKKTLRNTGGKKRKGRVNGIAVKGVIALASEGENGDAVRGGEGDPAASKGGSPGLGSNNNVAVRALNAPGSEGEEENGEGEAGSKNAKIVGAWKDNGKVVQAKAHHADRQVYARRKYRVILVRTALKPSTAYALLQLADLQIGHLVLDPMCGGGTIPLEAADWLTSRIAAMGGDKDSQAVDAARQNSEAGWLQSQTCSSDVVRWDASRLPLRSGCADRVICDMPFGVRCGSVKMREQLSPRVAMEVARILPLGTGRAVLMAQSKAMKQELLEAQMAYLSILHHLHVEMEGIRVDVIVVQRTELPLLPAPTMIRAQVPRNNRKDHIKGATNVPSNQSPLQL